jgi:hypothetical protein
MSQKKVVSRSSKTGKFVKPEYAKKHPATTVRQHVPVGKPGHKGR